MGAIAKWLDKELWTLWETAYLLEGVPPTDEVDFLRERDSRSAVAAAYRDVKDATMAGSLSFIRADTRDTLMRRRVRPADVVTWARSRSPARKVPDAFEPLVRSAVPAAAEPLAPEALLVSIDGRDAIPVRALPYVAGWEQVPPDDVAKQLGKATHAGFQWLRNTPSFHLVDGRPAEMLAREWHRYVEALKGLQADLKLNSQEAVGYATWLREAVAKLPAGVFVWRDQFELDYQRRPETLTVLGKPGERTLSYAPMLEPDLRATLLEGFQTRTPDQRLRERYEAQDAARVAAGRYTLEEVARCLEGAGERFESALTMVMEAAGKTLPVYEPGRNARLRYGIERGKARLVREGYEEARWDELNDWLAKYEPYISYRFPAPPERHGGPERRGGSAELERVATPDVDSPAVGDTTHTLPAGVRTEDLAAAFDGIHFGPGAWVRNLEDPSEWLKRHRMMRGRKGHNGVQTTWNPVGIAEDLAKGRWRGVDITSRLKRLNQLFRARSELAAWRDEWCAARERMADLLPDNS